MSTGCQYVDNTNIIGIWETIDAAKDTIQKALSIYTIKYNDNQWTFTNTNGIEFTINFQEISKCPTPEETHELIESTIYK